MDVLTPKTQVLANETEPGQLPTDQHIGWFRQASPYINAHRGKILVLCFSGSALASGHFPTLVQDITLLKSLGVKLVLVHGLRPQIDQQLKSQGQVSVFNKGLRITPDSHLDAIIAEIGRARIQIESQLSMGLSNTPMSGAHISVASGNFVTAQPYGVVDGVDYCHTGLVRQIHVNAIRRQIDHEQIVLLSPLGFSRTGEMFNLEATDVATQAAAALGAEKLVFMSAQVFSSAAVNGEPGSTVTESTPSALAQLVAGYSADNPVRLIAEKAIQACRAGVQRVHILDESDPNSLLKELYTRDGAGTMINADSYETLRRATIRDIGGIIELIKPLERDGTLVKRSREQLEIDIEKYAVIERDGLVITCAALLPDASSQTGEIACLATHPDYRKGGRADTLLAHLEHSARSLGIDMLYALTTRSNHWFIEHGFSAAAEQDIPEQRRTALCTNRNSKILVKKINRAQR